MASEDFEYQLNAERGFVGAATTSAPQGSASTYVDPNDGTVYEWDQKQRGWVPKIDDNFLAMYQASYGVQSTVGESTATSEAGTFAVPPPPIRATVSETTTGTSSDGKPTSDATTAAKRENTEADESEGAKKPKGKQPPTWFDMDEEKNRNVYVSGLPLDITQEELVELMSKCGIIMEDEDGKPKVKLYRDADGDLKGDALCCYLKVESIPLALNIIDGTILRNSTISVERAKFVQKGEYIPAKKKKKPKKKGNKQAKLLDWKERRADGPIRKKCERIIVFKNVFDPKEFDEDPTLITDIRSDIQEECGKFGTVKKIMIFDRHPEGITSVAFKEFEAADACVLQMNQRWYAGRQLQVAQWDGITNFQVEETDQEREERLSKWENFLKEEEDVEGKPEDSQKQQQEAS